MQQYLLTMVLAPLAEHKGRLQLVLMQVRLWAARAHKLKPSAALPGLSGPQSLADLQHKSSFASVQT